MQDVKLRIYDGIAISSFLILPGFLLTGLSSMVRQNDTAAWIVLLASALLMAGLFALISVLTNRHEGRDILEIASSVAGKPVALLYGIVLGAYFCYVAGVSIREAAEITKLYALFDTPLTIIVGCLILAALLMNMNGGASILKSVSIFMIVLFAVLLFALAIGANRYDPDHLFPVWGHGIGEIAKNSVWSTSVFNGVIVLTLFAPAFKGAKALRKSGILSLLIAAVGAVSICLCCLMSFSPPVSGSLLCNFIEMGKSSYFNHFFYRFESLLLLFLISISTLHGALCLFIAKESIARAVGRRGEKTIIAICTVAVSAAAILPANILTLTDSYLQVIRKYSACLMVGIPLIVHSVKRVFKHETH